MSYNELRKDYLLNRWVVIAKERSRRPSDFAKPRSQISKSLSCPMCVGNEQMTPPAALLFLKEKGETVRAQDPLTGERPKNWLVRCIPNLYPAFGLPKQPEDTVQIMKAENMGVAIGAHEVIVESPNHDENPAEAEFHQFELVIHAYIDRLRELSGRSYIKYVSIFRNYGLEAGASLTHAHSQVIATPFVPPILQEESNASKAHYEKHGRCIFCDIIEQETNGPRLISENSDFVVFAPYASINPMEFWIAPKKHAANMLNLSDIEISAFAKTLKGSLKVLEDLVNDPPYNYCFHLSVDKKAEDYYHWHIEVYPKISIWAGFEINTGIYINTIPPETAAESFRKALGS
jgi:UDPglucose--hexose-1-phosphate uridylyltransferase